MKLNVFQSGAGDCVLLSSDDDHHILVDGGFGGRYKDHVRDHLAGLTGTAGLDLVCVSHIDSDHIAGILQMLDDEIDWRVFRNHEHDTDGSNFQEPDFPRPPTMKAFWYNGFKDIVNDTTPIEEVLLFSTRALGFANGNLETAALMQFLATSVKQGLQLQNRLSPKQLGLPVNPPTQGKPLLVKDPDARFPFGNTLRLSLLGPFKEDLKRLRVDWEKFVKDNDDVVTDLRKQADEDRRLLGLSDAEALRRIVDNFVLSQKRGNVTPPNLASIVFLAEEGNQKALLTGDGRDDEIIKGLKFNNHLDSKGRLHVDILKLQHHGSINNVNRAFCKAVTADHYVVCGASGGRHQNPDIEVLQFIIDSRMGDTAHKSTHTKVDDNFSFFFSSNDKDGGASANAHMANVIRFMQEKEAASGGRFTVTFMGEGKDRLVVPQPAGGQPD